MSSAKKWLLTVSLSMLASSAMADSLSPQEEQALQQIRQFYSKQIGRAPTPQEEQAMLQQWRASMLNVSVKAAQINAMAGGQISLESTSAGSGSITPPNSNEQTVAKQLAALGKPKTGISIVQARDGLKIDGSSYLDPSGTIRNYAFDSLTGDITYSVQSGPQLVYKYLRAGSPAEPITIATAQPAGGIWQVTTASGKQISGNTVTPIAKGVMVSRGSSAFRYVPGWGVKSVSIPDGWEMAQFQRGNVGATNFVLLEKQYVHDGGLGDIFSTVKSMGALVGLNKKEDYALFNLENSKLYPLNIQVDGKMRSVMSNCRQKNALVNECRTMTSYESLYSDLGPNFGHYYWKVGWYNTPQGPIAITMENGINDVYVLDLNTGKKVSAFHRGMGITSLAMAQQGDGRVRINANWMFEDHIIEDAHEHLAEQTDINSAQTEQ